eukprot:CAMPEP_0172483484 /NCGR_PEP_ID=MMETSP1066-20121228/10496_1 /TAXON_ID=671091 /ORGANISM="Coscinodiscus wailesii, Strain CCMP2513" /LENGTH=398 /DNA_ID=CAMNT_0013247385 /DNA_START=66 /DNA_END=1262 /DNA_ORIENTATION=+
MVLQKVSANLPKTPNSKVKYLTSELERADAENETLNAKIAELTKALETVELVKQQQPSTPTGKVEKKGKKDKNAPKPAMTAYKYYCEELKTNDATVNKSAKEMQQMWKETSSDERRKFVELAAADKARYEREKAEYDALQRLYQKREQDAAMELLEAHKVLVSAKAEADDAKKGKKAKKDPNAPKRPMSAYMFFSQERRAKIMAEKPEMKVTEVAKLLGEEWNQLEKGKRGKKGTQKYDKLAAADKARYDEEKKAYDNLKAQEKQKQDEEMSMQLEADREEARRMVENELARKEAEAAAAAAAAAAASGSKTKGRKSKGEKDDKKPKGPKKAASAYNYFCAEVNAKVKATMPNATFGEISAEVGKRWKALSDADKTPYVVLAEKDKARYKNEVEAMAV